MRLLLLLLLPLVWLAPPAPAQAGPGDGPTVRTRYLRPHPLSSRFGKGYCHLDVPHVHAYTPDKPELYERVGESWVFIGDPVPFGYDGPRTTFYGHHPVPIEVEVNVAPQPIFCFIRGPHFHEYAAPATPEYRREGGVIFFVGPTPPAIETVRVKREKELEVYYRPYVAARPKVVVTPPPGWHGTVYVVPPPAVSVSVSGPSVHVSGPSIQVGLPGVVVAPAHGVYVVEKKSKHDNGKHKGWYKDKDHGKHKGKGGRDD